MNRILVALVLLQALVIAFLAFQLSERTEDGGLTPPRNGVDASVDDGSERSGVPRRSAAIATDAASRADSVPDSSPAVSLPPLEPNDPIGTIVIGSISRSDGAPLTRRPSILFTNEDTAEYLEVTIKGNAYSIVGMAPRRYLLTASVEGCREIGRPIDVAATSSPQRFDIVFEPAVVIRVDYRTPDNKPLVPLLYERFGESDIAVTAIATAEPPPRRLPSTSSRYFLSFGIGKYRTDVEEIRDQSTAANCDGIIEIHGPLPAYVSAVVRCSVIETRTITATVDRVVFTIPWEALEGALASLTGVVVDADTGEPIPEASITVTDRQTGRNGIKLAADGIIRLNHIRSGVMVLGIGAPGYAGQSGYFRFDAGKTHDLGRVRLAKGRTIEGVVLDEGGRPIKGFVRWRNLDLTAMPQEFDISWPRSTADDGTFKIDNTTRGRIQLIATTPGQKPRASTSLIVNTQDGSVADVRLQLQSNAEVLIAPKVARDRVYLFQAVDALGRIWWARDVWGPWLQSFHLPSGDYTLEVYEEGIQKKVIPLIVKAPKVRLNVEP